MVPVETTDSPYRSGSYDILNLRVGQPTAWFPEYVRVNLYNERTGIREDITLSKRMVAVIENPFYTVMNEPNSTVQRLISKLALLDATDRDTSSNKLNMIIQLPYVIKSEARQKQAEFRRTSIEEQLEKSKYGIAYSDATEKIIQLNKNLENKLFEEVQYLTTMLYNQLGLTQAIFDGTADEQTMLNYRDRTIEPIMSRICAEFRRKFISKTARTQKQTILFIQNPFSLVPVNQMAEIADKFTRNEILSPNEIRSIVGFKPADDEAADELRNRNISQDAENAKPPAKAEEELKHYGTKGMKWYHRYHQDYDTVPTRSGKVGTFYGEKVSFQSPQDLSNHMKTFRYQQFSGLKSPEQVEKDKSGDCHSQVMYEMHALRKCGINPKGLFFIEYNGTNGGMTHSLVYYKKDKKIVWFENAWGGQEGLHEYDSLDDLKQDIIRKHNNGECGNVKNFPDLEFGIFDDKKHKPGEGLQELVTICLDEAEERGGKGQNGSKV